MVAGDLNPRIPDPLLQRLGAGDRPALDELVALVYRDLHRMAGNLLRREAATGRTRPTSLVNALYLELQRQGAVEAGGARHFFQIAGYLMRQILVNRARRRASQKRGSGQAISALNGEALDHRDPWAAQPETLLALDSRAGEAGAPRPREGAHRRIALLWRPLGGGDRARPRDFPGHRETPLGCGAVVAV